MNNSEKRIQIAVSSCLAGNNVRYDGKNKNNDAVQQLCSRFNCITVCPKFAIGLGTPRPPLNIIRIEDSFRARGKTNPSFDVTESLTNYAHQFVASHSVICGFLFKSRSPSCGLNSTPWKILQGSVDGVTSGIFSAGIKRLLPSIPTIEDDQLGHSKTVKKFIQDVINYAARPKQT